MFNSNHLYITNISSVVLIEPLPVGTYNFPACLPHYELVYKLSGHSVARFGDTTYDLTAGCIRFLPVCPQNTRYSVDIIEEGDSIDIYFDSSFHFPDTDAVLFVPSPNMNLKNLFIDIYQAWKYKRTGYYARCMSLIYQIIEQLQVHTNPRYMPTEKYSRIKTAISYLEDHAFDPDFDYHKLAQLSNMSYSYFKQLYTQKMGCSPQKTIRNLRISYAYDLLASGMYSVTRVSEILGFQSVYYFSRVFKASCGVSPSEYRNSLVKKT